MSSKPVARQRVVSASNAVRSATESADGLALASMEIGRKDREKL